MRELEAKGASMLRFVSKYVLRAAELYLHASKPDQKRSFRALSREFASLFETAQGSVHLDFCRPGWMQNVREIQAKFLPAPPFGFLRNRLILSTMVTTRDDVFRVEMEMLKARYPPRVLSALAKEDCVGRPCLASVRYLTSHNSVHHLYHLAAYEQASGASLSGVGSVVEWGGGYGNMAKLLRRINPAVTYVIIDLPIFSCLQWLYLSSILGRERVRLIGNQAEEIVPRAINLLPTTWLDRCRPSGDLFIATWSLSECTEQAQSYVAGRDFFGAQRLLLAFQSASADWPAAEKLGTLASARGARVVPIAFLPGNFYAFR